MPLAALAHQLASSAGRVFACTGGLHEWHQHLPTAHLAFANQAAALEPSFDACFDLAVGSICLSLTDMPSVDHLAHIWPAFATTPLSNRRMHHYCWPPPWPCTTPHCRRHHLTPLPCLVPRPTAGAIIAGHWPVFFAAGAVGCVAGYLSSLIIKLSGATTLKVLAAVRGPLLVLGGVVLLSEKVRGRPACECDEDCAAGWCRVVDMDGRVKAHRYGLI